MAERMPRAFNPPGTRELTDSSEFVLELGSYEGPLDLLLDLARRQKVDLRAISVLTLAEQYLDYVSRAERLRIQLAADYLLMAAWLAYLKSTLLLPREDEEDAFGDELAALLTARLERLEAMRKQARALMGRPRLGRNVFARGMPEPMVVMRQNSWRAGLADLLAAYARVRTRDSYKPLHFSRPPVVAVEEALDRLRAGVPDSMNWSALTMFLPKEWRERSLVRSAIGSMFAGALELARGGTLDIRQQEAFAPLHVRRRVGRSAQADKRTHENVPATD
jgi:segregation and condensation protein A